MRIFQLYFIMINVITFLVFAIDKRRAVGGAWRISEATLFGLSIVGGTIGGILAMQICRHKTKHWTFKLGLPLILILQMVIFMFVRKYIAV